MIINGSVEFTDTDPRKFNPQLSSPGAEEPRVIITPGTCPCKACNGLDKPPFSLNIFSSTTVTAPVNDDFFCVPYPTTTTSSNTSESSSSTTFTGVPPFT